MAPMNIVYDFPVSTRSTNLYLDRYIITRLDYLKNCFLVKCLRQPPGNNYVDICLNGEESIKETTKKRKKVTFSPGSPSGTKGAHPWAWAGGPFSPS